MNAKSKMLWRISAVLLTLLLIAACGPFKRAAYDDFGDREEWQQPQKVIDSLKIQPGEHIADLGAGGGFFTFRLSTATGAEGRVYAVDVDSSMTEYIDIRADELNRGNVTTILSLPNDPKLPAEGVDLVFICNTYHHLEDRVEFFRKLKEFVRLQGRVAIIDFKEDEGFLGHETPAATIETEMAQAGYDLQEKFDYLSKQNFMIFVPAGR